MKEMIGNVFLPIERVSLLLRRVVGRRKFLVTYCPPDLPQEAREAIQRGLLALGIIQ
jgi:hypothetical protein